MQHTQLPEPPYYAVIFTSLLMPSAEGYEEMAKRMVELGTKQNGFLGVQSLRSSDGNGITISYWKTLDDISHWKANSEHQVAQELGKNDWYLNYEIRICKVERQYEFKRMLDA